MDDAMKKQQAQEMFNIFCQTMDADDWKYKKDTEKLTIECGAQGEDLPMELVIKVDAERQLIMLLSSLPFTFPEDNRLDGALAVAYINELLVHGCFDYNVLSGKMIFRMTNTFLDSTLSQEVCKYLLYCSCATIDEYNDKLLMLAKGMVDIKKFIALVTK